MKKDEFSTQQLKFLKEYARTLNAEKSALKAGYSDCAGITQAKKLLFRPKYIEKLNEIIEQNACHYDISKSYILKKYFEILNFATTKNDSDCPIDAVLGLRALDGLCKQILNFDDKQECDKSEPTGLISGLDINKI